VPKIDVYDVLLTMLVVVMIVCTFAQIAATESPLTGSYVLTVDYGSAGLWLNQAWIIELRIRPVMYATLIYDIAKQPAVETPSCKWDISVTYERVALDRFPMAVTVGRRWPEARSLGGSGFSGVPLHRLILAQHNGKASYRDVLHLAIFPPMHPQNM
jgi:hypothetical protein